MKASTGFSSRRGRVVLLAACVLAGCGAGDEAARGPASGAARAGRAFSVNVTGRGRPIVLIPGLASSGETWSSTVEHLRDRYACHVLTLGGFAGVAPVPGPFLARMRDEVARYIDEQRLDRPIVVGHSLGGAIVLDLAARHPGRVGPLVIVDSLPFMAGALFQVDSVAAAKPMLDAMREQLESQSREQYQAQASSGLFTRSMVASPEDLKRVIAWGVASDHKTVAKAIVELLSADMRADLARVDSPVLVMGTWVGLRAQLAARGVTDPRKQVVSTFEQQYAALPKMRLAITDRARHFVMFDDPKWFFAQLDAFLADPAAVATE